MDLVKPRRWPFFDFTDQLGPLPDVSCQDDTLAAHHARKRQRETALQAHFARLRTHFEQSLDAITVCRFSKAGIEKFVGDRPRMQGTNENIYRLDGIAANGCQEWRCLHTNDDRWQPVSHVGANMIFGPMLADTVLLDACVYGPHAVGTKIKVITYDGIVDPNRRWPTTLAHIDASCQRFKANKPYRVYDLQSTLPTLCIKQQVDTEGRRHYGALTPFAIRHGEALSYQDRATIWLRLFDDPAYEAALMEATAQGLVHAEAEFSLTARTDMTIHMAQVNKGAEPIRRQRGNVIIVPPQP